MKPPSANAISSRSATFRRALLEITLSLFVFGFRGVNAGWWQEKDDSDPRSAAVLMLEGTAESTMGGVTKPVALGMLVPPGTTLQTGTKSEMVLFFRQIGTMVRLRPNTTLVLELMTKFMKDGVLLKETVLELKEGEMMCVVRVLDEHSRFEVKFPGYVAAFDGAGFGRFDLNAKGTVLVGRKSERPFRVTSIGNANGAVIVPPGHFLSRTNRQVVAASQHVLDELRPKLDVLENLAKALTPPPRPEERPLNKRK
jgi:hypothetical protein